jgi:hypothetical protein
MGAGVPILAPQIGRMKILTTRVVGRETRRTAYSLAEAPFRSPSLPGPCDARPVSGAARRK